MILIIRLLCSAVQLHPSFNIAAAISIVQDINNSKSISIELELDTLEDGPGTDENMYEGIAAVTPLDAERRRVREVVSADHADGVEARHPR